MKYLITVLIIICCLSCDNSKNKKEYNYRICTHCNGNTKGWNNCPDCQATGRIACDKCGGTGKTGIYICNECEGFGQFKCFLCKGKGEFYGNCPTCHGLGKIYE